MIYRTLIFTVFCLFCGAVQAEPGADEIIGTWVNMHGPGIIKISRDGDQYIGQIEGSKTSDLHNRKDIHNPDPKLRSRKLLGLTIMGGLKFDGDNEWEDGWIYDPDNGKTFKCRLAMRDPDTLELTGYEGIALFGRTELWKRNKGG